MIMENGLAVKTWRKSNENKSKKCKRRETQEIRK
jgi:hypothetical protein